jgi:hypothetical protein
MSTSYNFSLVVGFQILESVMDKAFVKTISNPGKFHMEDRFDPKTGQKVTPVKIWDEKPLKSSCAELNGVKYDNTIESDFISELENVLGCNISYVFTYDEECKFDFYLHEDGQCDIDSGHVSVHNSRMDLNEVVKMLPKLIELKQDMESLGLTVGKPEVFISTSIG